MPAVGWLWVRGGSIALVYVRNERTLSHEATKHRLLTLSVQLPVDLAELEEQDAHRHDEGLPGLQAVDARVDVDGVGAEDLEGGKWGIDALEAMMTVGETLPEHTWRSKNSPPGAPCRT